MNQEIDDPHTTTEIEADLQKSGVMRLCPGTFEAHGYFYAVVKLGPYQTVEQAQANANAMMSYVENTLKALGITQPTMN